MSMFQKILTSRQINLATIFVINSNLVLIKEEIFNRISERILLLLLVICKKKKQLTTQKGKI